MGQRTPIFMGEVPEYVVKGDHMHISWKEFEFVLPISIMLACTATAQREIERWQRRSAEVVPFRCAAE